MICSMEFKIKDVEFNIKDISIESARSFVFSHKVPENLISLFELVNTRCIRKD